MRFKGWKNIFSFNYIQYIKTKAFIGSTAVIAVLFALIIAGINIIPSMLMGDEPSGGDEDIYDLKKLYIYNETIVPWADNSFFDTMKIETEEIGKDAVDEKCKEVAEGDKAEAVLYISEKQDEDNNLSGFDIKLYYPENSDIISKSEATDIADLSAFLFKNSMLMFLGVDEDDVYVANMDISRAALVYGAEESSIARQVAGTIAPIVVSAFMFVFIISYAQIIAQSIAQEKTSRVIELLITSVRPLAIIVGKVLAMLLVAVTQIAIIGAASGIVGLLTLPFNAFVNGSVDVSGEAAPEVADIGGELASALPGLTNPASITAIIVVLILGFLFYALLAGIVGAGVSRSEDLAAALQPLMMVAMVGFFLSYMPAVVNDSGEGNTLMTVAMYIPISSPFALPSAILLGDISPLQTVLSIGLLAVLTALTAMLVSKVYETIILYSGNPLKLSQIFKMAGNKKN